MAMRPTKTGSNMFNVRVVGASLLVLICSLGLGKALIDVFRPEVAPAPVVMSAKGAPTAPEVTLKPAKPKYFLGEEIVVLVETRNRSIQPLQLNVNAPIDRRVLKVADVQKQPCSTAVLGFTEEMSAKFVTLRKDEQYTREIPILDFYRIDHAGTYHVTLEGIPTPATVEVVEPTVAEAKILIQQLEQNGIQEKLTTDSVNVVQGFSRLTAPVYLPLMIALAKQRSANAILALGRTPSPEATKALIELLDRPEHPIVPFILYELNWRIPDPSLDEPPAKTVVAKQSNTEFRRLMRDHAWRDDFAQPLRDYARTHLGAATPADSTSQCAYLLGCIGTADDIPLILKQLDTAISQLATEADAGKKCNYLHNAMTKLVRHPLPINPSPKTNAEKILYVTQIKRSPTNRPPDWETTLQKIQSDANDYVRRFANQ